MRVLVPLDVLNTDEAWNQKLVLYAISICKIMEARLMLVAVTEPTIYPVTVRALWRSNLRAPE